MKKNGESILLSSQQMFWMCRVRHVVFDITRFNTVTQFSKSKVIIVQSNR